VFIQAAVGALRDVQELKESLQQVNCFIVVFSIAPCLAYRYLDHFSDVICQMQALAMDETDTEDDTDPNTSTQQSLPEEDASQNYKPVLDRLEGSDNPLAASLKVLVLLFKRFAFNNNCSFHSQGCRAACEAGSFLMQAVDGQVGLLAEGVAGLAGTLWSGARTASA